MPVRRVRIFLLLALSVVCASAVIAGAYVYKAKAAALETHPIPDLIGQLPSDAPALLYIDVAAIRSLNQQALTNLLQSTNGKNAPAGDNDYQKFVNATGFDYSRDLDHVAIAFWPAPPTSSGASGLQSGRAQTSPQSETPALVVAEGRFDRAKIQSYAVRSGHVEHTGKTDLYEIPGNPPVALRFLSASRLEMASGKEASARLTGEDPAILAPPMRDLVERVSGSPVFAVAEAAPFSGSVADSTNSPIPNPASFAKNVRAMTFAGQPSGGGFDIIFQAKCDSASNATGLSAILTTARTFGSMALADPKSRAKMTQEQADAITTLLSQIKIQQDDAWVGVTLHITPEMLAAAAKQASQAVPHPVLSPSQ